MDDGLAGWWPSNGNPSLIAIPVHFGVWPIGAMPWPADCPFRVLRWYTGLGCPKSNQNELINKTNNLKNTSDFNKNMLFLSSWCEKFEIKYKVFRTI